MSKTVSFELEYMFRASPSLLFGFLSTASGLTLWFADSVDIEDDVVVFGWEGNEDTAYLLESVENERIRYRWDYMDEDEYFEFRLGKSEVTGETILQITDFAEADEIEGQRLLWNRQIRNLSTQVGG